MRWIVVAVLGVALLLAYRAWLHERVGRLQDRVAATHTTLELQLDRRAHASLSVDDGGPVAAAALAALEAADVDRELAESALTRALRQAWGGPWPPGLREQIIDANERAHLARQFHSAALTALIRLRRRPLVRLLHVAGGAPAGYVEIDDTLPSTLGAPEDRT